MLSSGTITRHGDRACVDDRVTRRQPNRAAEPEFCPGLDSIVALIVRIDLKAESTIVHVTATNRGGTGVGSVVIEEQKLAGIAGLRTEIHVGYYPRPLDNGFETRTL